MNQRGQAELGVGGLIALLVLIAISALVLYEVTGTALDTAEDRRIPSTSQLANTSFTDNTIGDIDNWDNAVEGDALNKYENTSGLAYTLVTSVDNAEYENGYFYQAVTLSIGDGVSAARVVCQYRLQDNDNIKNENDLVTQPIISQILLDDGSDNTIVWTDNDTAETTTWTSISVDVSDNITATGTYTLFLRTAIVGDNDEAASNIIVQWDNANLSITTYDKSFMENAVDSVEDKGATVLDLLTILAIVIVAALIIGVVMRAIGGAAGGIGAPGAPAL